MELGCIDRKISKYQLEYLKVMILVPTLLFSRFEDVIHILKILAQKPQCYIKKIKEEGYYGLLKL